jgi:DNA repair protein RecO (recombination protein O)
MLSKDTAICIRATDFSETSQIVTFFSREHGKISAIAKGSKRPKSAFGGTIEIFSNGKIVFTDSDKEILSTLTEFEPNYDESAQVGLQKNLFVLNCCFFAAELLNKLTHDYDPHPELFDSFLQFLLNARKENNNKQILALLIFFQLTILKEIGLQPILSHCSNCKSSHERRGSSNETYFSSSANGIICKDCEMSFPDKIRISKQMTNCLGNLKLIGEAQEKTLKEIEKILIHHFTELLGHPPKMAKHILKI